MLNVTFLTMDDETRTVSFPNGRIAAYWIITGIARITPRYVKRVTDVDGPRDAIADYERATGGCDL